jgi:hypothetical protein
LPEDFCKERVNTYDKPKIIVQETKASLERLAFLLSIMIADSNVIG